MNEYPDKAPKNWYVASTRPRAEKKVHAELSAQGIDCYLPLIRKLRQYSDRKKWVELPLIPGYCFVHITRRDYDRVIYSRNVVSYVMFNHTAAIVPQREIDSLRRMLCQSAFDIEVSKETFRPGKKVMILDGPLQGMTGELVRVQGNSRFMLRIDAINTVFMVQLPAQSLTAFPPDSAGGD